MITCLDVMLMVCKSSVLLKIKILGGPQRIYSVHFRSMLQAG